MQENAASDGYNAGYDLPCYIRQSGFVMKHQDFINQDFISHHIIFSIKVL